MAGRRCRVAHLALEHELEKSYVLAERGTLGRVRICARCLGLHRATRAGASCGIGAGCVVTRDIPQGMSGVMLATF
jgi:hypothetical protein